MIKATKIKMNDGKENTDSLTEIKEIYLEGVVNSDFYMKETIHDFIVENPDSKIVVDLKPFPVLLAAKNGTQKYVRSQPNSSENDNLLKLPRV